ncbi:hypothetical protein [Pseudoalteromonas phage PH357]|nr:hypothetical protein [Pseudoalteromonas phage PH357]
MCEVYVIKMISSSHLSDLWLVLSTGLGGGIGCIGAILISNKFGRK